MAISVTSLGSNTSTSGATVALSALSVPANVLIVVGTAELSTASSGGSCTDSNSDSYTSIVSAANNNVTTNGFGQVFYFSNNSATLSSITYTKQTSGSVAGLSALYATGVAVSPLDSVVTAHATGSSATPSVTSGTPSVGGELFVGFISWRSGSATFTQDTTDGWSSTGGLAAFSATQGGSAANGAGGNQIASASTKFAPTISQSSTWAAFVVGFMAAAASTATYGTRLLLTGVGT